MCTVTFKCVFEEIWDFLVKFADWRTTSLLNEEKRERVDPYLDISFINAKGAIKSKVSSSILRNQKLPYWS